MPERNPATAEPVPRSGSTPTAPAPSPHARILSRVAFALIEPPTLRDRVELAREHDPATFDPFESAAALGRLLGRRVPGPTLDLARNWLERAGKAGRRILPFGEPGYPEALAEIPVPPLVLDVAGDAGFEAAAVAVIGARRATPYGIAAAEAIAAGLAESGVIVVSGLARGVDGAAHRAALAAGGRTIGVLGSAHDRFYPPEHAGLAREIVRSGAVMTEFPPGSRPLPHHFPRRNRIIAGLTLGCVVVEAAERSGSLSTARHALESNRDVFAVPGPISSPTSAGCHALIREGATLVASAYDVLDGVGLATPPPPARPIPTRPGRRFSPGRTKTDPADPPPGGDAGRILEVLARHPNGLDVDSLLLEAGLPVPRALAALSTLDETRRVRRFPGDFVRIAP